MLSHKGLTALDFANNIISHLELSLCETIKVQLLRGRLYILEFVLKLGLRNDCFRCRIRHTVKEVVLVHSVRNLLLMSAVLN